MALKIDENMSAVAYHITDGPVTFSYATDAQSAIARFPDEWSDKPWTQADEQAARKRMAERHAKEVEDAKARGIAPPPPLPPEPPPLTPEEQAAIDEHAKLVAEAGERLKKFYAEQEEKKKIAEQVAADEALVASPPPRPDPNAPRRPFGRKGEPTPAELKQMEKAAAKKAADDKMVADKAAADKLAANPDAPITG